MARRTHGRSRQKHQARERERHRERSRLLSFYTSRPPARPPFFFLLPSRASVLSSDPFRLQHSAFSTTNNFAKSQQLFFIAKPSSLVHLFQTPFYTPLHSLPILRYPLAPSACTCRGKAADPSLIPFSSTDSHLSRTFSSHILFLFFFLVTGPMPLVSHCFLWCDRGHKTRFKHCSISPCVILISASYYVRDTRHFLVIYATVFAPQIHWTLHAFSVYCLIIISSTFICNFAAPSGTVALNANCVLLRLMIHAKGDLHQFHKIDRLEKLVGKLLSWIENKFAIRKWSATWPAVRTNGDVVWSLNF